MDGLLTDFACCGSGSTVNNAAWVRAVSGAGDIFMGGRVLILRMWECLVGHGGQLAWRAERDGADASIVRHTTQT